ncbi:MAG: MFS transporter, partial [Flavobacteriaceae bacterium]|nr:MFS transporter [Flavobacteriaceae bacterium]
MIRSKKYRIIIIYLLAFLTGANFVIVPSLANIFTADTEFGLSASQFGNLFIPQTICIILSSLATPFLVNRFGPKKILGSGIFLMLLSTAVLWSIQFFMGNKSLSFDVLMIIVAVLGLGFGTSITSLNPIAANLFPKNESSAILIMQFLVVLGTSSLPFLVSFLKNSEWTLVPAILFIAVLAGFTCLLLAVFEKDHFFELPKTFRIPKRLWLFITAIVFYGLLEGTFGSYGSVLLKDRGLSVHQASLGLSLFWGGMALGRLSFGLLTPRLNLSRYFLISPVIVGILLFSLTYANTAFISLLLMTLSGFFMGSLFPGAIGWATVEFSTLAVLVSGALMAANQAGTALSTNTLGSLTASIPLTNMLKILSLATLVIF